MMLKSEKDSNLKQEKKLKGLYSYINYSSKTKIKERVACFNLFHTLIKPKSIYYHSINKDDWDISKETIAKLKLLKKNNFKIIIITNLYSVNKKILNKNISIVNGVIEVLNYYNCIDYVYISTCQDGFRKPNNGMWLLLEKELKVDYKNSFYCGNFGGRYNDLSDIDIKFAKNVGIRYYTPEEIFV